jgi:hypothetical protein
MNNMVISNWRSQTAEIFDNLRFQAGLANLSAKIFGKSTKLKGFSEEVFPLKALRIFRGTQDLPVDQINGSVGRDKDFDYRFRPLKQHLRERWVAIYAFFETDRFAPIEVYKYGNDYYVEDGHHRVSVARAIGQLSIRADIWEIPVQNSKKPCEICLPKSQTKCQPTYAHV